MSGIMLNMIGFALSESYWMGTLAGGTDDQAFAIAVDSGGNIYICGYSNASGIERIQLAKYNAKGVIQWQRNLNPSNFGYGLAIDYSDNIYVAGVGDGYQLQVVKYNSAGTIQWQRKLVPPSSNSFGNSIALDSSANVYICGQSFDTGISSQGILVVKYDTSGTIQWQRILQNSFPSVTDVGRGVAVDSSGNIYACGYGPPIEFSAEYQIYLVKYNTSGTLQWQRKLHGVTNVKDFGYGVTVDSSSNVYVVGESDNVNPQGISDGLIAKYDSSGTIQWQRRLGNIQGATRMNAVAVNSSGDIYICGTSSFYGPDTIQLAQYDSSGNVQWQRNITNATRMRGYSIVLYLNNIYVCGEIRIIPNSDMFIAKLPNDGSLTGTYTVGANSIIYAATTKTAATSTLTAGGASLSDAAASLTDSATTATNTTTTLTSTVTTL